MWMCWYIKRNEKVKKEIIQEKVTVRRLKFWNKVFSMEYEQWQRLKLLIINEQTEKETKKCETW